MRQREPAICLRAHDYSETSQVVHFLTRGAGAVRLLAKGTKRPKSKSLGAIDLLSEGDLVFSGAGKLTLGTLMEFTETVSHLGLRRDARRLNVAMFLLELVAEMLGEADPHVEVFDLLHNAMARLGQEGAPVRAVLAYFQWRLLRHVGLLGQLSDCVSCGAAVLAAPADSARDPSANLYFSSLQGGLLCEACEAAAVEKYRVDGDALAAIATLTAIEAGEKAALPDKPATALSRLLNYHITQQLGKPLKMARYAID